MLQYCFCFIFWYFGHEACGIVAPQPEMEPASLHQKVKPWSLDCQTSPPCWNLKTLLEAHVYGLHSSAIWFNQQSTLATQIYIWKKNPVFIEKDCCLRRPELSRSRESEIIVTIIFKGLLSWCSGEESASQCRRHKRRGFDSLVRKIPWRRKWQPPRVFLFGKSHGQRSLGGCNPWGHKE